MARAKKEAALTPEERLQAALVPDWEWPYKLPENWCWTKIASISNFERGITFPASAKESEATEKNIVCLRTANVQEHLDLDDLIYVDKQYMKNNEAKFVRVDDIIMSSANSRELVGKTSYVDCVPFPMSFGGFVLTIRAKNICSKYLFYYLRLEFLSGKFMGESTQTTNIANINTTTLGNYEFPMPPLAEQQRIVDRIESLFAKLDEAKEKAQTVLESFETRKAAILHKAFTGELTAKWREEHGMEMESWDSTSIGTITTLITKGASPRWQGIEYTDDKSQTLFVTSENVREGFLDLSKEKYLSNSINEIQKRSILKYGDVLVNIVGASIGRAAIFNLNQLANTNQAVCIVRLGDKADNRFICYFLNSPTAQSYYVSNKVETARANVSLTNISEMPLELPTIVEQAEIVRILDDLFTKEQQAKEAAEAVLEKIDLMKKAILARAFRGELGTNDPKDEPAVELVKKII